MHLLPTTRQPASCRADIRCARDAVSPGSARVYNIGSRTVLRRVVLVVLCICLVLPLVGRSGETASITVDSKAGARKADDERCRECHGEHGDVGPENEAAKIPRLAGQHPQYLLKQLQDFASGARKHDFMERVAADLNPQDAADIIAYYTGQPAPPPAARPGAGQGAEHAAARRLYAEGDPTRALAACASCHGGDGRTSIAQPGVAAELIPTLGGQDFYYVEEQLLNWRSGARGNSPLGIMSRAVRGLTDAEIVALAKFLEAL